MSKLDTLGPFFSGEQTYEDFVEKTKTKDELIHHEYENISLCDELYARIGYRTIYNDRKIFEKAGNYYRPTEIHMVGSNIRHEFMGLYHAEHSVKNQYYLRPLQAIQLLAGVEGFLNNQLNIHKKYKEEDYSLSYLNRDEKQMLCINYGEGRKESHLDKYKCRVFSATLKSIISTSNYRY